MQTPVQKYWHDLLKHVKEGSLTPDMVSIPLSCTPVAMQSPVRRLPKLPVIRVDPRHTLHNAWALHRHAMGLTVPAVWHERPVQASHSCKVVGWRQRCQWSLYKLLA